MIIDVALPTENQEGTESILASWLKNVGDAVNEHDPLVEISTDKVSMEIAAPVSGVLVEILKVANEEVKPGEVIARIDTAKIKEDSKDSIPTKTAPSSTQGKLKTEPSKSSPDCSTKEVSEKLSPIVKKLLEKHGLNPASVQGSGKGGRITADDVLAKIRTEGGTKEASSVPGLIPHNPMRLTIAKRLSESMREAPHVTAVFEVNLSSVFKDRDAKKAEFLKSGVKLSYTSYFVRACVDAIKEVPDVNAEWHDKGIKRFSECNIGIGTALEDKGLVVPVLRNSENLNLLETAKELQALTDSARAGKLSREDLAGGTFTISNHGVSGSLFATPIIINPPQVAVLGIGKIEQRPFVAEDGSISAAPKCYVSLSIDHRALDGFQANAFLSKFVSLLENWN